MFLQVLRESRVGRVPFLPRDQPSQLCGQPPRRNFQADLCGRCKKIAPVFADLQNEFSDDPVLFLTFDMTSEDSRRQAERLSRTFGIEKVFDKHRYTGVIVLATPDGQIWDVVNSDADIALAVEVVSRNLISGQQSVAKVLRWRERGEICQFEESNRRHIP